MTWQKKTKVATGAVKGFLLAGRYEAESRLVKSGLGGWLEPRLRKRIERLEKKLFDGAVMIALDNALEVLTMLYETRRDFAGAEELVKLHAAHPKALAAHHTYSRAALRVTEAGQSELGRRFLAAARAVAGTNPDALDDVESYAELIEAALSENERRTD